MISWNFLCGSLCLLPLILLFGTTEKTLAPSWHPPFRYLYALIRPPLSLLQAEQALLPQPFLMWEMVQSLHHFRSPSLDSPWGLHTSFVPRSPELDTVYCFTLSLLLVKKIIHTAGNIWIKSMHSFSLNYPLLLAVALNFFIIFFF